MNKDVSLLLNIHQPDWQNESMLSQIVESSYWVLEWISKATNFKATLNLTYSLTELLLKHGHKKVIDDIGLGLENKRIELTGTAAYHPILPILPDDEIKWHIGLNDRKHKEIFGDLWEPRGFFPPEMAFSPTLAKIVKEMGYEWIITEDVVHDLDRAIPNDSIAAIDGLPVFFRSSHWSNTFSSYNPDRGNTNAEEFVHALDKAMPKGTYMILAFDGETIGHCQYYTEETMAWLANTMEQEGINSVFVSDLLDIYPRVEKIAPSDGNSYEGSWSTSKENISANNPFPLWKDPTNVIHASLDELTEHVRSTVKSSEKDPRYGEALDLFYKGQNSCKMWWATKEWWDRKNILDGSKGLYLAVMALQRIPEGVKKETQNLYDRLVEEEGYTQFQSLRVY